MGDADADGISFAGSAGLDQAIDNGRRLLASDPRAAAAQAREILKTNPYEGDALRLLAKALRRMARNQEAEQAELDAIKASSHVPALVETAIALKENRLNAAEHLLRPHLVAKPDDAAAIRMLAEIALRVGADRDAEQLLRQALALAPAYASARLRLSWLLVRNNQISEGLQVLDGLLATDPGNADAIGSKAAMLGRIGDYAESIALYERLIDEHPDRPGIWLSYGHLLNTVGRLQDSIAAYRRAIAIDPSFGEAWWSVANLKTVRLNENDIAEMEAALSRPNLDEERRLHLHFALGRAHEDAGAYEASFHHYAAGNAIRHSQVGYDPDTLTDLVRRSKDIYSAELFATKGSLGYKAADPIFIVGTPRAGSTLIEQILSTHSLIEGTSELPYIPALTRRLEEGGESYPELIADLDADALRAIGEEYLESAHLHRKTNKPFFIDKLPNNWINIGLIRLALPNARIIDARRHPLDSCFSNFKQNFASGQGFSYALEDLGRFYADYVDLLDHFDAVLPGHIHRVLHEAIVSDTEAEVRRLLAYLGLPFEETCLRFYENERAVRTPSAEQVRRPINREGMGRWKGFEPWLGPLKLALGAVLESYPASEDSGNGEHSPRS